MVSSRKVAQCPKTGERAESRAVLGAARPRKSTKGKQRPSYRRRVKPPFSYAELITMAIRSSVSSMMTLREILEHMAASYECFRGAYIGWKNSVRHNLSANECFVKVLRNTQRPYGKDNFWTLNATCLHCRLQQQVGSRDQGSSVVVGDAASSPDDSVDRSSSARLPGDSRPASPPSAPLRWPSPTPGATPGVDAPAPAGPSPDEWGHLEGLFVPDDDIDLALYNDELEMPSPHPPYAPVPGGDRFLTSAAASGAYPVSLVKTEYPSSYPWPQPVAYTLYSRPGHDLSSPRYVPPSASPNLARLTVKTERTVSTSTSTTSRFLYDLRAGSLAVGAESRDDPRGALFAGRRRREEAADDGPGIGRDGPHHRLGSIVASAIRGSLSLDLDESALLAIERSVELLDRTRPGDFASA